jgi:hypothetical protein
MKKLLLLLPLLLASPAYAKAAPCVVTPDPVSLSADSTFTVTATGLPNVLYEVTDQQTHHHKTDEARVWLGYADDAGNISAVIDVIDGRTTNVREAMWPGDVSVKVLRWKAGGGTSSGSGAVLLTTCGFTVIE